MNENEQQDVTMPKLGETVTEGTVSAWLKNVGDAVAFDDPLFEVSTDKVDSEIPSQFDGVLLEVLVDAGTTVAVGTVLARIGAPGSAPSPTQATAVGARATEPNAPSTAPPTGNGRARAGQILSPVVRRLAVEGGVDLVNVVGSGVGGRIRREDVELAVAAGGARPSAPAPPAPPAAPAPAVAQAAGPASRPAARLDERDVVEPLSRMRLAIADRMTHSVRVAPHVWTSIEVDLERIELIRTRHKAQFRKQEGMSLTYLGFVARAVCDALRAFPNINSSIDIEAKTRTLHSYVNLGIAVDLNEQGLIAPVIKDADTLNLRGLARAIRAAATKATGGTFTADDLSGSTFTITNPGPIGDYASAPLINQPNSAILSTNMVSRRPTVVGDAIAIHHMTILGFCYDHRAFDGVTASRFLAHIRDALQERDWETELA